jgi:hypothetical protein
VQEEEEEKDWKGEINGCLKKGDETRLVPFFVPVVALRPLRIRPVLIRARRAVLDRPHEKDYRSNTWNQGEKHHPARATSVVEAAGGNGEARDEHR